MKDMGSEMPVRPRVRTLLLCLSIGISAALAVEREDRPGECLHHVRVCYTAMSRMWVTLPFAGLTD